MGKEVIKLNKSKSALLDEFSLRAKLTDHSVTITVIRLRDGAILQRIIPLVFDEQLSNDQQTGKEVINNG